MCLRPSKLVEIDTLYDGQHKEVCQYNCLQCWYNLWPWSTCVCFGFLLTQLYCHVTHGARRYGLLYAYIYLLVTLLYNIAVQGRLYIHYLEHLTICALIKLSFSYINSGMKHGSHCYYTIWQGSIIHIFYSCINPYWSWSHITVVFYNTLYVLINTDMYLKSMWLICYVLDFQAEWISHSGISVSESYYFGSFFSTLLPKRQKEV